MLLDHNNDKEHELYVRAMRAHELHNKPADHTKVATTPEEIQFMRETSKATTTNSFSVCWPENAYERIFSSGEFLE